MTFSAEWNEVYEQGSQNSIWPWTDLVSLVYRYARPQSAPFRVLELGCGAGANIPFMLSFPAVNYFGIDGSAYTIQKLQTRYPQIKENLFVGDFTQRLAMNDQTIDLVIDRAAVTHNQQSAIERTFKEIKRVLKPGGKFIGIDWFSPDYSEAAKGKLAEDAHTKTGFVTGPFAHIGRVHFSDETHMRELLKDYKILLLEHKVVTRQIPKEDGWKFASWNFVAEA